MEKIKEYFESIKMKLSINWHPVTVPDQRLRRDSNFFKVFEATANMTYQGYEIND